MRSIETMDIELPLLARDELFALLNAYPDYAPVLASKIGSGQLRGDVYIFRGCGCIYGNLALQLYPSKAKDEKALSSRASDLREPFIGKSEAALEAFTQSLFPSNPKPPFYPLDHPVAITLLQWISEWQAQRQPEEVTP